MTAAGSARPAVPQRCRDALERRALVERAFALGVPRDYGRARGLRLQREPTRLVSIGSDIHGREQWLQPRAARALARMRQAASRDGVELQVVSAFRSIEYQLGILERKLARGSGIDEILHISAAPGYSEHHTGRCVDLATPGFAALEEEFARSTAFAWLQRNAAQFGFALSFPRENRHGIAYEPWHWCWHAPAPLLAKGERRGPPRTLGGGRRLATSQARTVTEFSLGISERSMQDDHTAGPDSTAVRTALWRALHVLADAPPHVFEDEVGLKLIAPEDDWRNRPDMGSFTKPFRAGILARARFIEDLVEAQVSRGVDQYVLLGAGLDSFAQRKPELAARLRVFELDQPGPQDWKPASPGRRLGVADHLKLVPVDFEAGDNWLERLAASGFDVDRPAVVTSSGVSMYLTRHATMATLRQIAALAPGSTLVMSFLCPIEMLDPEIRTGVEHAADGARAAGTPWISFFKPGEIMALARDAGFRKVRHVSAAALAERYFADRTDGLRPPDNSEELLVATA